MTDHIRLGLDMTKFAINHPWKFKDPHTAFFCGFSKVVVNFVTELLNYSLLLTSNNVIYCLWNFMGLNVIRTLGNYIYATIRHSPQKKNIANPKYLKIFTIQTTTSESAKAKIPAHELKPDGICPEELLEQYPKYIYISFWERTCGNKVEWLIYVFIKAGYVSVWYYFAPLMAVMLGYVIAAYLAYAKDYKFETV